MQVYRRLEIQDCGLAEKPCLEWWLGFLSWRKEKNEVLVEFHRRREKNMRWRNSTVSLKHIKKSVISNSKGFYHRELRLYGAGGIGYTFYSKIKGSRRLVWKC